MTKSFLTATAFAALLTFGASAAGAQQNVPTLEAPAIQKSAPVDSGKAVPGAVQNKSATTMQQGAAVPTGGKAKHDTTAANPTHSKAKREAAATVKTPADQKAATPDKSKSAPRVGG